MKILSNPICKREIFARFEKIGPETPRQWGRMTAGQMICHLNDAFLGVMGHKPAKAARGFSFWRLTMPIALYAPLKWPQGVPTRPEFDQQIGGTPPSEFSADMQRLVATMAQFLAQPRAFEFQPHPMFGVLSEKQWMRWAYLHTDHHLRQFGA
jgi:hypothetical protein